MGLLLCGLGRGEEQKKLRKPALEGSGGEEEADFSYESQEAGDSSLPPEGDKGRPMPGDVTLGFIKARDVIRELARARPAPSLRVFTHLSSVITRGPAEQPPCQDPGQDPGQSQVGTLWHPHLGRVLPRPREAPQVGAGT